ncbi:unnamed protein product, partial [Allacma fusca]
IPLPDETCVSKKPQTNVEISFQNLWRDLIIEIRAETGLKKSEKARTAQVPVSVSVQFKLRKNIKILEIKGAGHK